MGVWETELNIPLQPIHTILMKNGRLLCLDSFHATEPDTITLDPTDGSYFVPQEQQGHLQASLFCGAHCQLADGKVFIVGGGGGISIHAHNRAFVFDPDAFDPDHPWAEVDLIPDGPFPEPVTDKRWYSTATLRGTGEVLVTAGRTDSSNCGWDTFESDQDIPLIFDPDAGTGFQWTRLDDARKVVHYYPFMFQLSDQTVFMGGGGWFTSFPGYDPEIHLDTYRLDVALGEWIPTAVSRAGFPGGSAVLYRPDRVMKAGAGLDCNATYGTDQVERIDLSSPSPVWTSDAAGMTYARRHFYLIVLPDGRVLAVGGGNESAAPVLTPEWIDPEGTNAWEPLAPMSRSRQYHSSSVLLPDGRVFMAGEGGLGHQQKNFQLFRPPYLFNAMGQYSSADRPVIDMDQTPDSMEYSKGLYVYLEPDPTCPPCVPDSSWRVSLIRLGAATHSFDHDQRFLWLSFTPQPSENRLRVAAPAHANLAPPGYYMLIVLGPGDREGILFPSKAKIVQVK